MGPFGPPTPPRVVLQPVHNHTHNMALELAQETIWFDKWKCDDAEKQFYEKKTGCGEEIEEQSVEVEDTPVDNKSPVEEPKNKPQPVMEGGGHRGGGGAVSTDVLNRITKLENEKSVLQKTVSSMEKTILDLTKRLAALETGKPTAPSTKPAPAPAEEEDDDDDVDLFGSDDEEEDAEAALVREERLAAYAAKKSKKPGPIAKSSVLLDCKPWDDETDMAAMEAEIRKISMDGLIWGAGKLQPVGYGINKLSILCTVEDEKVSIDELSETIQEIEDYVQSVDIAAFNKI